MAEFPAMNVLRTVPRFSEGVFPNIKQTIEKCTLSGIYYPSKLCLHLKRKAGSLWKILDGRIISYFSKVAFYKAQHWILPIFHIFFKQNQNI